MLLERWGWFVKNDVSRGAILIFAGARSSMIGPMSRSMPGCFAFAFLITLGFGGVSGSTRSLANASYGLKYGPE